MEAQWSPWAPKIKIVNLQQDNVTPHIKSDGPAFLAVLAFYALAENGRWTICLHFKPLNSPNFNILNLIVMVRAMQSLQQMHQCRNIEEFVDIVKRCWADLFPLDTCKKVWTSLQLVLNQCLKAGVVNNYKLPHMSKDKYIWEHSKIPLRLPALLSLPPIPRHPCPLKKLRHPRRLPMENLQLQTPPQKPHKSNKNSPFSPSKQLWRQTLIGRILHDWAWHTA
jgi:hypothetical protein